MLRKLSDPLAQEPDTWYGRLWIKVKSKIIHGFIPLLKTTAFIFDYVKDFCFFLFALNKSISIASNFLKSLIYFHGATILTSGVLMGLAVQFNENVINLDSLAYPNLAWPMRVIIFIATPLVPVVVILRALSLTTMKRRLESEWVNKQESTCQFYLKHNKLVRKKRKVMKALSDIKLVEVSTEGVPQIYILLVFLILPSDLNTCVGILDREKNDPWEITFLVFSILQTYTTILLSTISSINIKKDGQ